MNLHPAVYDISDELHLTFYWEDGSEMLVPSPATMKLRPNGSMLITDKSGDVYDIKAGFNLVSWRLPPGLPDDQNIITF